MEMQDSYFNGKIQEENKKKRNARNEVLFNVVADLKTWRVARLYVVVAILSWTEQAPTLLLSTSIYGETP